MLLRNTTPAIKVGGQTPWVVDAKLGLLPASSERGGSDNNCLARQGTDYRFHDVHLVRHPFLVDQISRSTISYNPKVT